jgi:hypothetical protein
MANTSAHLVDRVVPAVPVRQWVLSLPFELRALAAFRGDVLSALARVFVESVFARNRAWAKRQGLGGDAASGAVTFVQRFGSSVNLNVHFHTMVLDGVVVSLCILSFEAGQTEGLHVLQDSWISCAAIAEGAHSGPDGVAFELGGGNPPWR